MHYCYRMLARFNKKCEDLIRLGYNIISSNYPPIAPAFAASPSISFPSSTSSPQSYDVSQIINDMRTLLGVPKYRTSKRK